MERFFSLGIRVFKSASFVSLIGTGLRVGGGLITLPLALKTIPQAQMGLYYTFMAINGMALLLDFGFAPSITRNAAYAMGGAKRFAKKGLPEPGKHGAPNWALLGHLKFTVQRWYWAIATLLALLLLLPGSWYIFGLIRQAALPSSLIYCWLLCAMTTAYSFATSYWATLLQGIGSVSSAARIGLVAQIFGLLVTIISLSTGLGLWAFALGIFFSTVTCQLLTKKAFLRDTSIPAEKTDWVVAKEVISDFLPMAWRQGLVMIGAFLIQRGNTLITTTKLGLDETASYGLSQNLLGILFQVSLVPLSMAWPEISRLRLLGQNNQIRRIFLQRTYCGLAVAVVGVICGGLIGQPILDLLGSQTQILPSHLFILLGLILCLEHHHSAYGCLVLSENHNPFIIPALVSGVAIFISSWWAADIWQLTGVIACQGIVQLAWNNWWTVARGLKGLPRHA